VLLIENGISLACSRCSAPLTGLDKEFERKYAEPLNAAGLELCASIPHLSKEAISLSANANIDLLSNIFVVSTRRRRIA
jgi:hypothetical protein